MGKKGKRQSDPEREDCCSTDDEQKREQDNQNSCPHTGQTLGQKQTEDRYFGGQYFGDNTAGTH